MWLDLGSGRGKQAEYAAPLANGKATNHLICISTVCLFVLNMLYHTKSLCSSGLTNKEETNLWYLQPYIQRIIFYGVTSKIPLWFPLTKGNPNDDPSQLQTESLPPGLHKGTMITVLMTTIRNSLHQSQAAGTARTTEKKWHLRLPGGPGSAELNLVLPEHSAVWLWRWPRPSQSSLTLMGGITRALQKCSQPKPQQLPDKISSASVLQKPLNGILWTQLTVAPTFWPQLS